MRFSHLSNTLHAVVGHVHLTIRDIFLNILVNLIVPLLRCRLSWLWYLLVRRARSRSARRSAWNIVVHLEASDFGFVTRFLLARKLVQKAVSFLKAQISLCNLLLRWSSVRLRQDALADRKWSKFIFVLNVTEINAIWRRIWRFLGPFLIKRWALLASLTRFEFLKDLKKQRLFLVIIVFPDATRVDEVLFWALLFRR